MRGLPVTLGIDLSTTSAKAAVVRADGKLLALSVVPYPTTYLPDGGVEQDAEDWWRSVATAVRTAIGRSGAAHRVIALCAATQGISVVPVDRDGAPLHQSINWLDTRATHEVAALVSAFSNDRLYALTGRRPHAAYTLPKIAWIRQHKPDLYTRTARWLLPLPYLTEQLTGRAVADHTIAAGTYGYDVLNAEWSHELLAWAGLSIQQLPELAWAGSVVGPLITQAAEALALPAGVPVVLGSQDQKCAAHFVGLKSGVATISMGTAAAISGWSNRPLVDDLERIPLSPYMNPNSWVLEGVVPAAGACIEWLSRLFSSGRTRTMSPAQTVSLAADSPPGANGVIFVPHLAGPGTSDPESSPSGSFSGLHLGTTTADLSRAVLEGVAREVAANVEILKSLGIQVEELRLFGGGARSPLWSELVATASGVPTTVAQHSEATALGAARIALEAVAGSQLGTIGRAD